MRLVLVADHVFADGAHELVVLVELEQLRLAGGVALKREQVPLRIDRDGRDAAAAFRQSERIRECEAEIGRAHFVGDGVALAAPRADRRRPARLRAAVALNRARAPGRRRLAPAARPHRRPLTRSTTPITASQDIAFHVNLRSQDSPDRRERAAHRRFTCLRHANHLNFEKLEAVLPRARAHGVCHARQTPARPGALILD